VLKTSIVILLKRGSVDLDVLGVDDGTDLEIVSESIFGSSVGIHIPSA